MEENLRIKPTIEEMKPNEIKAFPIERLSSVRVYCSDLGATLNRKYKSRKSFDGKQIEVIRIY